MDLSELLKQVDELKIEIDALRPIDPEQEQRIMQKFRLDLTYHSNAIEGNQLTFGETKAFLLHGTTAQGKPFRDYLDIRGHHAALDHLLEIVRQQMPLTEASVRELHKIILVEPYDVDAVTQDGRRTKRRITPGQYKSMPNHVETSTGEMHYYASPEATPAKMADLMAWYRRQSDKEELHPLILAATFHYQFITIHPFDDGNGRMARLLMNLIGMQAGFPPIIIPLDIKNEYLLALEQADEDNELTPFIILIGQMLLESLNLFVRGASGERIEELEDIDKKLDLLQRKLASRGIIKDKERNSIRLHVLYNDLLQPLLTNLHDQFNKFDRFFSVSYSMMRHTFNGVNSSEWKETEWEIAYLAKAIQIHQEDVVSVEMSYTWEQFVEDEGFEIIFELKIDLRRYDFEIKYEIRYDGFSSTENLLYIDEYQTLYSQEEKWKDLVSDIVNEVFKIIERKTENS